MNIPRDLVVLDLETTGTWIEKDKIVEIAMIKTSPGGQETSYHKTVNPTIPIPPVVSELINIKDEDVKNAPKFEEIAGEVLEFVKDCDFGGFNVERFDLPLLERELTDSGHIFIWKTSKIYDAQKVYHLNEKRDLTAAYKFYCGKNLENAHSALADTKATLEILQAQVKKYAEGEEGLSALDKFNYKAREEFYDEDRRFRWWNGKLYMMFGKYARRYSLQEVAKKDKDYLAWILSANFSEDVKVLVAAALEGKFPEPAQAQTPAPSDGEPVEDLFPDT